jgi:hypothetical protein
LLYQWSSSLPNADRFTFLVADFFKWKPSEPFDLIFDYMYVSIYLVCLLFWRQFRSPLVIHAGSFVHSIQAWGWLGQRQLVAFWNQMESLSPWYIWWGLNLYVFCFTFALEILLYLPNDILVFKLNLPCDCYNIFCFVTLEWVL